MKITDSIFKIMMGLSILILSVSLLVFATKSSYANENSAKTPYMPAEVGAGSKYTLQYNSGVDGNGNFYWQMVLFNPKVVLIARTNGQMAAGHLCSRGIRHFLNFLS
jgi:hypothetical protein